MSDKEQADQGQTLLAKVAGLVAAAAVAWVAQRVVSAAWKTAVGHEPPKAEDDTDAGLGEVVAAAAITSGIVALARVLATRGTKKFAKRVNDNRELPG